MSRPLSKHDENRRPLMQPAAKPTLEAWLEAVGMVNEPAAPADHPMQAVVDAAHTEILGIIQMYVSGLITVPEFLTAAYKLRKVVGTKAIVGVVDPATHLKRVK
jgi:hypothetical protein